MAPPPRPATPAPLTTVLNGTLRSVSARYRLPRVVAVVAIAVVVAATVARANDRASLAAAAWELADSPVLVVTQDIPAGQIIDTDVVALRAVPVGLLPADAMHALPPGSRATTSLTTGEILRSTRVDPDAASPIAALLPRGHLAFSVPAGDLSATVGDAVRLYDLATGSTAVRSADVLAVDEGRVTVAVPAEDAPRLIAALGAGGIVAAITRSEAPPGS